MKSKTKWAIRNMKAAGRAYVPALVLALVTAASTMAATEKVRSLPPEKGATGLVLRIEPECLPSETEDPKLARLAADWQGLAPELRLIPTVRSNQVTRLAIYCIRQAPSQPILAFLHGVLSDHETWRFVAAALAGDFELWMVDLPGCGESEPLKRSRAEPDAYSLDAMGERVLQAVRHCLAQAGPGRQLTLVGHSLGGSVVIRMLSSPDLQSRYGDVLERVDRAVLIAPCDLAANAMPPKFITVLGLKHWLLMVGEILGVTDSKIKSVCGTHEQQRRLGHILKDKAHLEATQWMLLSAVPFDERTRRPIWTEIDRLIADYRRIHAPVLIVYGEWDESLMAAMGNKLKDEIAGAWLVKVPGRGHSLPTEDPEVCANLIRWFQHGGEPVAQFSSLKIYPPAGSHSAEGAPATAGASSAGSGT